MKKSFFIFSILFLCGFSYAQGIQQYTQYNSADYEEEAERLAYLNGHASPENAIMTSKSQINWTKNIFSSDISLDVEKSGIPLPSGKASSVNKIQQELPVLVKDPLLSIYIDNTNTLGDLVLSGSYTLEQITEIVNNSKQTPAVFMDGGKSLLTRHTLNLLDISGSLVKHHVPYETKQPLKTVASRAYSGIVIDARGTYQVHGEFVKSRTYPCLFPKVWNENMDLVYERNMVEPEIARKNGIVHYSSSKYIEDYQDKVGKDPLWIKAKKVYGINRTDPVISQDDFLKITSVKKNMELLKQGKVVILLDEDLLVHGVQAPDRNKNYFIAYHQMRNYIIESKIPDVVLNEGPGGIKLTMDNLRFIADSPELLPEERPRISQIAESLKRLTSQGNFTILVEGHTADVNKPTGQLNLSIERAKAIIDLLIEDGVDKNIFTFRGYGATKPVADNSSPEGRAQNRRVEITAIPKSADTRR